ncbi:protein windbeutel [Cylas formicarius]|uniref:protein windbeutel n=1 Tax=Cylas formicarius TaxID=197179 RepID=UPI0029587981|nr:protein windbeutel [Cylas formicarius]XP_060533914.1 protein windbeutel [Cylas formicarius]
MRALKSTLCVVLVASFSLAAVANKGTVNLDEHNFEKIVQKFEVAVAKFDPSYPYGEKHEAFMSVADELKARSEILFAQVGIKDWGDKENENLGKKFGVKSKNDYPALRLFVQGEDQPFEYNNNQPWTVDDIKRFIRDHTNIYLGLPGCLEKFDKLAQAFSGAFDKASVVFEAETEAKDLKTEKEKQIANRYIKYMKKALEKDDFISEEKQRLNKIIAKGKLTKEKKEELSNKINILSAFTLPKSEL